MGFRRYLYIRWLDAKKKIYNVFQTRKGLEAHYGRGWLQSTLLEIENVIINA